MQERGVIKWLEVIGTDIIKASGFVTSYIFLPAMLLLILSDPIMRYLVGRPIYWSNEVSSFLLVVSAYAGLAITLVKGKHVRATLIFDKLSAKVKTVMWVIISLVTVFYVCCLTYGVGLLAYSSLVYDSKSTTAELHYFRWQLIVVLSLVAYLMAIIMFTAQKIGFALGLVKDMEEEKVSGDWD